VFTTVAERKGLPEETGEEGPVRFRQQLTRQRTINERFLSTNIFSLNRACATLLWLYIFTQGLNLFTLFYPILLHCPFSYLTLTCPILGFLTTISLPVLKTTQGLPCPRSSFLFYPASTGSIPLPNFCLRIKLLPALPCHHIQHSTCLFLPQHRALPCPFPTSV
jgi:hypothetical protein